MGRSQIQMGAIGIRWGPGAVRAVGTYLVTRHRALQQVLHTDNFNLLKSVG